MDLPRRSKVFEFTEDWRAGSGLFGSHDPGLGPAAIHLFGNHFADRG